MGNATMNDAIRAASVGRRDARAADFDARHAAAVTERLRRAYLGSDPTATPEDFDRALPGLREELRRRAAVGGREAGR